MLEGGIWLFTDASSASKVSQFVLAAAGSRREKSFFFFFFFFYFFYSPLPPQTRITSDKRREVSVSARRPSSCWKSCVFAPHLVESNEQNEQTQTLTCRCAHPSADGASATTPPPKKTPTCLPADPFLSNVL